MEEQTNFNSEPATEIMSLRPRRSKFWKFLIPFLVIIALVVGGYFAWVSYLSPEAKQAREMQANYDRYFEYQKNLEETMRADTYGGKTPEETLNLFIEALRKEDIDLAFQYFILKENGERDPKWKEGLIKTRDTGKLQEVANLLAKAKPSGPAIEGYYGFIVEDNQGEVTANIELRLNQYSGVWKIESL